MGEEKKMFKGLKSKWSQQSRSRLWNINLYYEFMFHVVFQWNQDIQVNCLANAIQDQQTGGKKIYKIKKHVERNAQLCPAVESSLFLAPLSLQKTGHCCARGRVRAGFLR